MLVASTVWGGSGSVASVKENILRRRAYGLRDEEYLRLKVLTCRLPILQMIEIYPRGFLKTHNLC